MFSGEVLAQTNSDSLSKYSYTELHYLILASKQDTNRLHLYVKEYKQRAFKENKFERISAYYRNFVFYQAEENRLPFIDSALHYAYKTEDKALIGGTYLTKATVYHNIKDYQKTLDNYLKANDYIAQTDNAYSKHRIENHIAVIKNYLGYYEEAQALFEDCIAYFGQDEQDYNMQRGYISSLEGLAWSYTKTNRLKGSQQVLTKALASVQKARFSELDGHYIVFKQGINDYFLDNYDSAIHKIEVELPFLYQNEDFAWASIGEFYIGKSYWEKGNKEKAITYFKKIDEVFKSKNYTHPDLREAYEILINHYKEQNDKDNQINYIEQLIEVDRVFNENHKYLINQIHKEYTTKDLLREKKALEVALYIQKNKMILLSGVATLFLLLVFFIMNYRHKRAKKAAQELIRKIKDLQTEPPVIIQPPAGKEATKPLQLKDELVEQLLTKLTRFEKKQAFLKPNITLEKLASSLGTNTTYLSLVINNYKKRSFSEYLNALRIEFVVNEMVKNKDSIFFKYSIESLAKHVGYNNATVFSRAFQNHTQVKPSVFIKEMLKNKVSLEN